MRLANGTEIVLALRAPTGFAQLPVIAHDPAMLAHQPAVLGAWTTTGALIGYVHVNMHASAPMLAQPRSELSYLIANLHVEASWRSQGLGLELILAALTLRVPTSPTTSLCIGEALIVLAVDVDNTTAIRLYEHCGFRATDDLFCIGTTLTLMRWFRRD